jgi:hypothetical protein
MSLSLITSLGQQVDPVNHHLRVRERPAAVGEALGGRAMGDARSPDTRAGLVAGTQRHGFVWVKGTAAPPSTATCKMKCVSSGVNRMQTQLTCKVLGERDTV